jgi:hypothetical protein
MGGGLATGARVLWNLVGGYDRDAFSASCPSSVREQNRPMGLENCSSSRPAALPVTPIRVPPGLRVLLTDR